MDDAIIVAALKFITSNRCAEIIVIYLDGYCTLKLEFGVAKMTYHYYLPIPSFSKEDEELQICLCARLTTERLRGHIYFPCYSHSSNDFHFQSMDLEHRYYVFYS